MTNYEIKENAMDYVRYVSIKDNRSANSYQKWYNASRQEPSQGLHLMKMAECSRFNQIIRDLEYQNISIDGYVDRARSIIKSMYSRLSDNSTIDLAKMIRERFPQTYAKRLAIIYECEDDFFGEIKLASNKKSAKKFLISFFKVLVK